MKHSSHARSSFNVGPLMVAYCVVGVPLTAYGVIAMLKLSRSNGLLGLLGVFGLLFVIIIFMSGRSWVKKKEQQIAQRRRDRRAVQIYDRLRAGTRAETTKAYSLYLRPFASTGRVRIPLRSTVYKRGILAGPTPGDFDPELGDTTLYKRYVTFGDFETELAGVVEPYAPLIALGRTGEQIGAGRIESDEKDWRTRFELLAKHATVIFLVPSTHEGTRWEIACILNDPKLLGVTVLFIPPNDTVLGYGVGPHLEIGASRGPVGVLNLRGDAIEALGRLIRGAPIARIKKDEWGGLLRLGVRRRVSSYHALRMTKSLSLNPFAVGSNMRIDRVHLRGEIQSIMRRFHKDLSENSYTSWRITSSHKLG